MCSNMHKKGNLKEERFIWTFPRCMDRCQSVVSGFECFVHANAEHHSRRCVLLLTKATYLMMSREKRRRERKEGREEKRKTMEK